MKILADYTSISTAMNFSALFVSRRINHYKKGISMIKKLIVSLLLIVPFTVSAALNILDLSKPENAGIKSSFPEYSSIEFFTFDDTLYTASSGSASTSLYRADGTTDVFAAHIYILNDRKVILFSSPEKCEGKDFKNDVVMRFNKQNITMNVLCQPEGQKLYIPKNINGLNFIVSVFDNDKPMVMVKFTNKWASIPFATKGFKASWDSYGGDNAL